MLYLVFQEDPGNYRQIKFISLPEKIMDVVQNIFLYI